MSTVNLMFIFLFVASNANKVFMNKNSNTYLWETARLDKCSKVLFSNNTTVLNHFASTLRPLQHTYLTTNISTMKNNEIESSYHKTIFT